eukprot:scaffold1129_cov376-Prasinococcus_capsulatus_cf.AAC.1
MRTLAPQGQEIRESVGQLVVLRECQGFAVVVRPVQSTMCAFLRILGLCRGGRGRPALIYPARFAAVGERTAAGWLPRATSPPRRDPIGRPGGPHTAPIGAQNGRLEGPRGPPLPATPRAGSGPPFFFVGPARPRPEAPRRPSGGPFRALQRPLGGPRRVLRPGTSGAGAAVTVTGPRSSLIGREMVADGIFTNEN